MFRTLSTEDWDIVIGRKQRGVETALEDIRMTKENRRLREEVVSLRSEVQHVRNRLRKHEEGHGEIDGLRMGRAIRVEDRRGVVRTDTD